MLYINIFYLWIKLKWMTLFTAYVPSPSSYSSPQRHISQYTALASHENSPGHSPHSSSQLSPLTNLSKRYLSNNGHSMDSLAYNVSSLNQPGPRQSPLSLAANHLTTPPTKDKSRQRGVSRADRDSARR